jgi:hypothetical protein
MGGHSPPSTSRYLTLKEHTRPSRPVVHVHGLLVVIACVTIRWRCHNPQCTSNISTSLGNLWLTCERARLMVVLPCLPQGRQSRRWSRTDHCSRRHPRHLCMSVPLASLLTTPSMAKAVMRKLEHVIDAWNWPLAMPVFATPLFYEERLSRLIDMCTEICVLHLFNPLILRGRIDNIDEIK